MTVGVIYPKPTYIPPLPIFNPVFFPTKSTTSSSGGGGGGGTNIFPTGLSSGNQIIMNGGTTIGTGTERSIEGISYLDFTSYSNILPPTPIIGQISQSNSTMTIGSLTSGSGTIVNLQGSALQFNGTTLGGGNVFTNQTNTYTSAATNTFDNAFLTSFSTTGYQSYASLSAIPDLTTQIGATNYSFLAVALNSITSRHSLYFYDELDNPYNSADWNALALTNNETFTNITTTGTSQIGTSFITDSVTFTNSNFLTVPNNGSSTQNTTIINAGISSTYNATGNTIIGPSSNTTNIIIGKQNTIVGSNTNITFDCSNNTIFGYNNAILSPAYLSGAFGYANTLQNKNTTIIGNNANSSYDNTIHLAQTPYISNKNLWFNPYATISSLPSSGSMPSGSNNIYSCVAAQNQLYNYDGTYWSQVTQKNYPFGYSNNTGLSTANIQIRIFTNGNPPPNTMVTFHLNCVFNITDTSVSPYQTTTLMISGAMFSIDLYAVMVQGNTSSFSSSQSINNNSTTIYPSGFADLGMIKVLQPSTSDWINTYPNYPQLNSATLVTSTNYIQIPMNFVPAPIATVFPSTIQSSCNAILELKNDIYIPAPYQINVTSGQTNYPLV